MLDDPDLQRDKKLSEHVMRLHSRNRKRPLDQFQGDLQSIDPTANSQSSFVGRKLKQNNDGYVNGGYDPYTQSSKFGDNDSFMEFDAGVKGSVLLGT